MSSRPWISGRKILGVVVFALGWLFSCAQPAEVNHPAQRSRMLEHVMETLPRYGDFPATVATPKPEDGDAIETVQLKPLVIYGRKALKLTESQLYTIKGFNDMLRKRYGSSAAYGDQEYRDEKRFRDMADLKRYTDNLRLAGDISGSREIEKESARLFMRGHHDWKTEALDEMLNSRYR